MYRKHHTIPLHPKCFIDPNPTRVDLVPVEIDDTGAIVLPGRPRARLPVGSQQALAHQEQAVTVYRQDLRHALAQRLRKGFCDPIFNVPFSMLLGILTYYAVVAL